MKVQLLGTKELQIGELKKEKVSFIKITPTEAKKEYVSHHILLADVSMSMSSDIRTLREKILTTMQALLDIPNSYVSVITYSGHQQSKRIINALKCDKISYSMTKVNEIIEKEFYTKGVTVMSEPLQDSIDTCKSLMGTCDKHHIALFTDGCLVANKWSEDEERRRCFAIAEICKNDGIFLNAVGFGQYYDRRFLKELIDIAGNGSLMHIDKAKEYEKVMLDTINKVNSESVQAVDIEVIDGKLFNISTSMFKTQMKANVSVDNVIAVIGTNFVNIDDTKYNVDSPLVNISDNLVDDFYYSLSRLYLQEEDIDNFEFMINYLGDVELYRRTQNCYSFIEKGNAVSQITEALNNPSKRFLGGRDEIKNIDKTEGLCLLELLQSIMEDENSMLYWDLETPYHRVTQASIAVEDAIKFNRQKTGLVPVTSIAVGSEKLNIGIKVKVNGTVTDEISGYTKESCIYRDYNLVNGGNVNVPYINVKPSPELFIDLHHAGLLNENICETTGVQDSDGRWIFQISLNGIKSANKRLLKSMTMTEIRDNLKTIADLKCKQWAVSQVIKEVVGDKEKVDLLNLSFEEQEIRKLLRIDENGIYKPLSVEKDNDAAFEIYPAVYMTWDIAQYPEKVKKQEHLNSIKTVLEGMDLKAGKDDIEIYEIMSKSLKTVRKEMRELEFKVNCVRIASAMMNKAPFIWEVELEKDKKTTDKVLNRNMVIGGKIGISKKTVGDDIIEQKRWTQLVKAN